MDQIHNIPQEGNQKKKKRERGRHPQGHLPQLWTRPSAAEDKGKGRPGQRQRTSSREPIGSPLERMPPPFPGARFARRPLAVEDAGGHDAGRLQSRREEGRSESATFFLRTKPPAVPAPKEYQGSHE